MESEANTMGWSVLLGGALGGAFITTLWTIWFTFLKRRWEKQDADIGARKLKTESEFAVYNEILKADGEIDYVGLNDMTGLGEFKLIEYKKNVRPILYKDFHKLNSEIRLLARELDDCSSSDIYFNTHDEWRDKMAGKYTKIIVAVEKRYQSFE